MKTLRILAMLCATAAIFISCSKDDDYKYELQETVWVSDENEPKLPMYTEQGYNTFGARFNREYFLSYRNGSQFPCLFSSKENNKLEMTFNGHVSSKGMQLKIVFPCGQAIRSWKEMVALNGKTIDLTDPNVVVTTSYVDNYDNTSESYTITPHNGSITFKKVNLLNIDGVVREAVVAGEFNFGYEYNGNRYIISSGRFDIGVDEDIFW